MKVRSIGMKMPDLASNPDTEFQVKAWLIEVGQQVRQGDVLLEVETDKAAMEVECIADGVLTEQHVVSGDNVPVGAKIATIEVGS